MATGSSILKTASISILLILGSVAIYQNSVAVATIYQNCKHYTFTVSNHLVQVVSFGWNSEPGSRFTDMLSAQASPEKFIILAMTDYSFRDMAMSMYESSFKKFSIKNFLFIGNGRYLCDYLGANSVPCFHYSNDSSANTTSDWGTTAFVRKMNVRTDMILEALRAGYTVLHTDVDVVFLKNPIPDLKEVITKNDMGIMWDEQLYNAGFLVIKPTNFSISVYEAIKNITDANPKIDDQWALNYVLKKKKASNPEYPVATLDPKKYLCGFAYYEKGNRIFPVECAECLVVHNNWIVSKEAKVYRFKEHMTWMFDGDAYYTSSTRKYISYSNPLKWKSQPETEKEELEALKAAFAIGRMLNRTVILPRFHCYGRDCPLNSLLNMVAFDRSFAGKYRESSFLNHSMVPSSVKVSSRNGSKIVHLIVTKSDPNILQRLTDSSSNIGKKIKVMNANLDYVTEAKIQKNFASIEDKVLEYACLYGISPKFSSPENQKKFDGVAERGLVRGKGYRQIRM